MDIGAGGLDSGIYAVGGGGFALIAQMLWQKFVSTEGKANDQLVTQQADRMAAYEQRLTKLEADLDEERRLRRRAEDKVHQLQLDNVILRAELKRHGIDVPAPVAFDLSDADDLKPGGTA
jgi:hypothetical protein